MSSSADPPNPYAAPPVSSVEQRVEVREEGARSAQGSAIRVGPRRTFTSWWIFTSNLLVDVGSGLLLIVAVAFLLFGLDAPGWAAALVGLWILGVVGHQGLPRVDGADLRLTARQRSGFTVDLRFDPRLPGPLLARLDSADDVGVLWIDGDWLCHDGDSVTLRVHRADVGSVDRRRRVGGSLLGVGANVVVRLRAPVDGRQRFEINIREPLHGPATWGRARRLKQAIEAWFAGATDGAVSG